VTEATWSRRASDRDRGCDRPNMRVGLRARHSRTVEVLDSCGVQEGTRRARGQRSAPAARIQKVAKAPLNATFRAEHPTALPKEPR
jgi:hypothetical protein